MTDDETIRRGHQAQQALQVLKPVFETMTAKAIADLLEAAPDALLQRQAYAQALAEVRKTIEGHVRQGEFVTAARQ